MRCSVSRWTAVERSGRLIVPILTYTALPAVNREFLTRLMTGWALNGVRLAVATGDFDDQLE
ncbi:MAG: hypothetical protein ND866_19795 [Pyrinomonadaceae bacterium]|nr:hypothetical protein [Pyrinomonadaceae bacterium]